MWIFPFVLNTVLKYQFKQNAAQIYPRQLSYPHSSKIFASIFSIPQARAGIFESGGLRGYQRSTERRGEVYEIKPSEAEAPSLFGLWGILWGADCRGRF